MLKLMRERASSLLIKILLGAIVVVFVFWGVGSFKSQRSGNVALVNDQPITVEEFRQSYNNLMEQVRRRFGNNLNDEMIKMLQVKKQAMDLLINQRLLLQEAERLNFRVSDAELSDSIRKIGAFQIDGVFDSRRYNDVLNRNRLTPAAFEAMQRESLLMDKLRSFIAGSVKVSDQEANEWYKWDNAQVNIDFVVFEPENYKNITPSAEEIKKFFDVHKGEYKTEPRVKVRYLHFAPDAYASKVNVTDEDINEYYMENQEEFKTPATVNARHILIKVDADAAPEAVEKARLKARDILKMAVEGGNFADLAKKYSQCPSKDKGGDLGSFTRESMVKPFADKAFSMKAGEISDPVRTRFGWHLIKVEKVNEASVTSKDEARDEIRKKTDKRQNKNACI
jgi:peptidyl-prolyl cis-trans isomerase D